MLFTRSVELLQRGCNEGSARACGQVGWLYERGYGTPLDIGRAKKSYQVGCDGNDAASCYNLAVIVRTARADDPSIGAPLERACSLGVADACMDQCTRYVRGDGVPHDGSRAAPFCERACNSNVALGCNVLGALLLAGDGVPKDFVRSSSLFVGACEQGVAAACTNVGVSYERGHGMPKDPAKAELMYKRGCDGNDRAGCQNLERLARVKRGN
jgi:TPR repeat protein